MQKLRELDRSVFVTVGYVFLSVASLACLLPFLLIIAASFSTEKEIIAKGFSLWPRTFSLSAYEMIFRNPNDILTSYTVTTLNTIVGTAVGLLITALAAFVLSRKDFRWRNQFSFFFYFTTLFSGGLVPWYIWCVQYLKFKQLQHLALIAPYLVSVFNLIIMKSFMSGIPDEVCEAAKIDGAKNTRIFWQVMVPLSKPSLATVGLLIALGYWNDWFLSYMFSTDFNTYTLQFFLYKTLNAQQALQRIAAQAGITIGNAPTETMKMAMVVIATGPILLLYPYIQKFFVQGLTIGAVKG